MNKTTCKKIGLMAAALSFIATLPAQADIMYPTKGQSAERTQLLG
ncbi:MAG: hypothetical protein ACU837_15460 [Gammaproteobacteria bacterium]